MTTLLISIAGLGQNIEINTVPNFRVVDINQPEQNNGQITVIQFNTPVQNNSFYTPIRRVGTETSFGQEENRTFNGGRITPFGGTVQSNSQNIVPIGGGNVSIFNGNQNFNSLRIVD
jgi:hypothetical protein